MDCKDIDKLLTDMWRVQLTRGSEQVKAHLAACRGCREEMEIRQVTRRRLGKVLKMAAARVTPPTGSWENIAGQAGIKSSDAQRVRRKSGLSWLAIPLSIFLLVILAGSFVPMRSFVPMIGAACLHHPPQHDNGIRCGRRRLPGLVRSAVSSI
jgi:hypothetical protein